MRTIVLAVVLLGSCVAASAQTTPPPAPANHAVPGWYLGMPVLLYASPPPDVERSTLERFPVFVHAPVSASAGAAPMKQVPHPLTGEMVALPPHQATLSALNSAGKPRLGIGYFVVRGTNGSADNVRVQSQPDKSWPSSPLVSHILIGPEWVGVNNHLVVEYGLATGILALEFFDVGDMMLGEFMDPTAKKLGAVDVRIEQTAKLPDIDWKHDQDHQPGQQPAQAPPH